MKRVSISIVTVILLLTIDTGTVCSRSSDDVFWSPVGGGLTFPYRPIDLRARVLALYPFVGNLVVAGDFLVAGGVNAPGIARWSGSTWNDLAPGFNMEAAGLTTHDGLLTAGGLFTMPFTGGMYLRKVASFNGTAWTDIGSSSFGDSTEVLAFCDCNSMLWAGGRGPGLPLAFLHPSMGWITGMFSYLGEVRSLACKGDTLWAAASTGLHFWVNVDYKGVAASGDITALVRKGDSLIIAGTFVSSGLMGMTNVAILSGTTWSRIGYDFSAQPLTIAIYDNQIVAGGKFTNIGGVPFRHIAAYRDGVWHSLGSGTDSTVTSLAVYNGDLYVGGCFVMAGADTAKAIARWSKKVLCCTGATGNIDCDPSDGVDIGDLTTLIDNLFINFTSLCCEAEANCDGLGGTDIGDLTSLIDNLFVTFTPLPACQ